MSILNRHIYAKLAEEMDEAQEQPEIHYLGDVARLSLKPDDIVVFSAPGYISSDAAERLRQQIKNILGENREVLILADGLRIGVLEAEAA